MSLIPKFYMDSVVSIGKERLEKDKEPFWMGTGFLVGYKEAEGSYSLYVVTNYHVIENQKKILIRFNMKNNSIKDYEANLYDDLGNKNFTRNPNDLIDIATFFITAKVLDIEESKYNFFRLESNLIGIEEMQNLGIMEGDLIYTLGFPLGIVGTKNKSPFCRLGCISRIEDLYLKKSETQDYIIDCQIFPGNSGGPVLSRPEILSIEGTNPNSDAKLIGILHSYLPWRETFISTQTSQIKHIHEENSGLTYVYPTDYIIETIKLERERIKKQISKKGKKAGGYKTGHSSDKKKKQK